MVVKGLLRDEMYMTYSQNSITMFAALHLGWLIIWFGNTFSNRLIYRFFYINILIDKRVIYPMSNHASGSKYETKEWKEIHFDCYRHLENHNQHYFYSMIYDLIITLKLLAPIYAIGKSTYPLSVSYSKMYHNFLEAYLLLPAHLPYKN